MELLKAPMSVLCGQTFLYTEHLKLPLRGYRALFAADRPSWIKLHDQNKRGKEQIGYMCNGIVSLVEYVGATY